MMYGVPLVQEAPQLIYGDFTSLPIPNLNLIPLTTMHKVDGQVIHYLDQDGTPPEFRPLPFSTMQRTDTVGISGLMAAPKYPPVRPVLAPGSPPVIQAQPASPLPSWLTTGVVLSGAVILLGSVALWAYSKFKK